MNSSLQGLGLASKTHAFAVRSSCPPEGSGRIARRLRHRASIDAGVLGCLLSASILSACANSRSANDDHVDRSKAASVATPAVASSRPAGDTAGTNLDRIRRDLEAIESALDWYARNNAGKYPDDVAVIVTPDINGATYLRATSIPNDPWGRPYVYAPPMEHEKRPRVFTLGRDGEIGGTGEDRDVDNWTLREEKR